MSDRLQIVRRSHLEIIIVGIAPPVSDAASSVSLRVNCFDGVFAVEQFLAEGVQPRIARLLGFVVRDAARRRHIEILFVGTVPGVLLVHKLL